MLVEGIMPHSSNCCKSINSQTNGAKFTGNPFVKMELPLEHQMYGFAPGTPTNPINPDMGPPKTGVVGKSFHMYG